MVLDGVRELIDGMLRENLTAPRKQRHTARRVFERLCDEHGAQVSYSYVAKYVARRRGEIAAQDRARGEGVAGFVPQAKEPGAEAEVDFGEVTVCLAGEPARCYMFAYRLSCSGKACHRVYASQAQEAFFEGHVAAFEACGGVPSGHIRYDNLSPAVARVLTGRSRTETGRWLSFRAVYGFEAFYCIPGREGAHEKGGVEGETGRFRRRWFVPVPQAASLAELNARLAQADAAEDARHIDQRAATVGEDFAAEAPFLLPLPAERFDTAATLWPRADRYARIAVGKCRYSVPARLIDARVRVRLSANQLEVYDGSRLAAVHPRLAASGAEHLDLDHYLEILSRKPGALPGAAALVQALHEVAGELDVVIPVHPRGRAALEAAGLGAHPRLHIAPPLGYLEFVALVRGARAVITDSGGVQEETTLLRVPCLTLRPNTERPVTVTSGSNRLVTRQELASAVVKACVDGPYAGELPPLWDGQAGPRIARVVTAWLDQEGHR